MDDGTAVTVQMSVYRIPGTAIARLVTIPAISSTNAAPSTTSTTRACAYIA
jgi:hypothetical protein